MLEGRSLCLTPEGVLSSKCHEMSLGRVGYKGYAEKNHVWLVYLVDQECVEKLSP